MGGMSSIRTTEKGDADMTMDTAGLAGEDETAHRHSPSMHQGRIEAAPEISVGSFLEHTASTQNARIAD